MSTRRQRERLYIFYEEVEKARQGELVDKAEKPAETAEKKPQTQPKKTAAKKTAAKKTTTRKK